MSIEKVRAYFAGRGMEERVMEFPVSSATVELAAAALCVIPARIAKTLSFKTAEGGAMLIVCAGDAKIDNHKFKEQFRLKAKMLTPDEAVTLIGHAVGGVCPFAVPEDVPRYLDVSLRRFSSVFPACGSANSAIELSCDELSEYAGASWIDVCKDWTPGDDPAVDARLTDVGEPSDGEILLRLNRASPADPKKGYVPAYHFDIVRASDGAKAGVCDLRLGYRRTLYYGGHIGYTVDEPFRGHGYAERACRLLLPIARLHGMPYVFISCRPENLASRRTLEKLGGTLLETAELPPDTELYRDGAREECIFRFPTD